MSKTPEQVADKIIEKRRAALERAFKIVVPQTIGETVLALFSSRSVITIDDLIAELERGKATEPKRYDPAITALQSLKR